MPCSCLFLPNDKFMDECKTEIFAHDRLNMAQNVKIGFYPYPAEVNPLPDNKILDFRSKLKQIADDISKCTESKKKIVPHRIENIVTKGEIACYKQFLLFSQCFPQLYILSASK